MREAIVQLNKLRQTIAECLDLEKPKSFFLYAGAGTGKTRAVVEALGIFRDRYGTLFRRSGQKVAVITYTNAACDEIRRRIDFDPIFAVSTIHSFAWEQIRTYQHDISACLHVRLSNEIDGLYDKQSKSRTAKAAAERKVQIESKRKRLKHLDAIKQFTYNPNGENVGKNSLNHAEVIAILAEFLSDKQLLRQMLIRKHPVLLIDESQDTQKDLICAFFALQAEYPDQFSLCLFGDTMQRIYADGKVGLEDDVPNDWETPALVVNHRCPRRIVTLLNQIRSKADDAQQKPRQDAQEGVVRLFLVNEGGVNKLKFETEVARKMAEVTFDDEWLCQQKIKVLTLEHHMAARRGGFKCFFEPLYKLSNFRTGLLDGTLNGVAFFTQQVLPLVQAMKSKDKFTVARIVKDHSPILSPEELSDSTNWSDKIRKAGSAVESMFSQWNDGADPVLLDILKVLDHKGLFIIPDVFAPILLSDADEQGEKEESAPVDAEDDRNPEVDAWREALSVPFSQFEAYAEYISDRSPFGTHQGIKGLQFPRVMVILDDNEAKGFMFSYEKLLGAKALTNRDKENRCAGRDTSVDRTRRLFYVTCSRAQRSLAVIVYTKEADKIASHMSSVGWFEDEEVVRL